MSTAVERITDPKRITQAILSNLRAEFSFVPHEFPGVYTDQFEESGKLIKRVLLSNIREWCGLGEVDDTLILTALDNLAVKGKIRIFRIELTPSMRHTDMGFRCEVGRAIKEYRGVDGPRIKDFRFYSDSPLTKKEMQEPHTVLNPREQVENIRERRDTFLRERFGGNSREAEIEIKRAVMEIAKK